MAFPVTVVTGGNYPGYMPPIKAGNGSYYVVRVSGTAAELYKASTLDGTYSLLLTTTLVNPDDLAANHCVGFEVSPDGNKLHLYVPEDSTTAGAVIGQGLLFNLSAETVTQYTGNTIMVQLDTQEFLMISRNTGKLGFFTDDEGNQQKLARGNSTSDTGVFIAGTALTNTGFNYYSIAALLEEARDGALTMLLRDNHDATPVGPATDIVSGILVGGTFTAGISTALPASRYPRKNPISNMVKIASDPLNSNTDTWYVMLQTSDVSFTHGLVYASGADGGNNFTSVTHASLDLGVYASWGWSGEMRETVLAVVGTDLYAVFIAFGTTIYLAKRTGLTTFGTAFAVHTGTAISQISARAYNNGTEDAIAVSYLEGTTLTVHSFLHTQTISANGISSSEAFGTLKTSRPVIATGIATSEVMGAPVVQPKFSVVCSSIQPPAAPTSVQTINRTLPVTGVPTAYVSGAAIVGLGQIEAIGLDSSEAFGVAAFLFDQLVIHQSLLSDEEFGLISAIHQQVRSSPASFGEVMGNTLVNIETFNLLAPSIQPLEAFGSATIRHRVSVTGISSAEAFGPIIAKNLNTLSPASIGSVEAFGVHNAIRKIHSVSIGSAFAAGLPNMTQRVVTPGIASSETFPTHFVRGINLRPIITLGPIL